MKNQISRILQDKIKLCFIIILIALPSLEISQYLWYHYKFGIELQAPMFATFLSANTIGHIFQSLLLWFLPLYLLLITGSDSMEDYTTGYKNILIVKMGRKKYVLNKLTSSFITAFAIMLLGLLINFILVQIILHKGTHVPFDINDVSNLPDSFLFELGYTHPLVTNLLFILIVSFLAGLISMVGTSLSIVLHDKKIVYALTFAIWFLPILSKNSLMYVTQPFAEYDFDVIVPIFLWVFGFYLTIIGISYVWEVKIAKI